MPIKPGIGFQLNTLFSYSPAGLERFSDQRYCIAATVMPKEKVSLCVTWRKMIGFLSKCMMNKVWRPEQQEGFPLLLGAPFPRSVDYRLAQAG